MTLGKGVMGCRCNSSDEEQCYDSSKSSSTSTSPAFKFHQSSQPIIKIGSVSVRFAQNFRNDDCTVLPLHGKTAKHKDIGEDGCKERYCCGVPSYHSPCIPPLINANNRCSRLSFSRNNLTGKESRPSVSCTNNILSPPVRRCLPRSTQITIASFVRPLSPIGCFGKREIKCDSSSDSSISSSDKYSNRTRSPAVCCSIEPTSASCRKQRTKCCCTLNQSRITVSNCAIYDGGGHESVNDHAKDSLILCHKTQYTEGTLDQFQKFRFGGDKISRNTNATASRRGSGSSGGSHKKKSQQRTTDISVNLKKLTEKLKQTSTATAATPPTVQQPQITNDTLSCQPLNQIVIPVKNEEFTEDGDDIFERELKLMKPKSRTIVGSYYQRSIPFRSASFSQVFYSPDDRAENSVTLSRTNSSTQTMTDLDHEQIVPPQLMSKPFIDAEEPCPSTLPRSNFSAQTMTDKGREQSLSIKLIREPLLDGEVQFKRISDDQLVSLIDRETNELLKTTISVIAPEIEHPPQAPKRTKHKHKHRYRPRGRLYFSDENIFPSNNAEEGNEQTDEPNAEIIIPRETISVTITPPQTSDTDGEEVESESTKVEVKFVDPQQDLSHSKESDASVVSPANNTFDKREEIVAEIEQSYTENSCQRKLKVDVNHSEADYSLCSVTTPSSSEDSLKPYWPSQYTYYKDSRLTPQTSTEREDNGCDFVQSCKQRPILTKGDSYSEPDSDHDKWSVSPCLKERPLSPSPCGNHDLSYPADPRKEFHSPLPYSKRPLRGPYLEMIVNEQKKPENFRNLQLFESRFPPTQKLFVQDTAVNYYLRGRNTSHSNILNMLEMFPKRKMNANLPFSSAASLLATPDDKGLVLHQRTISSPSQLEYYPDQNCGNGSNEQLLHQLLRGSSECSLSQGVDMFLKPTYKDTRSHIVVELYDTERSYVESLQILVTKYLQPLKTSECGNLIEPHVVEEIFCKIPEILVYHELFLEELRIRLERWNKSNKCIGDIFLETFTKPSVIDAYIAFVNNWKTARESIKQTCHMKPAFARFLETMAREHKGKLALDSLLIMPVQRIPRYELLIQSLLKHTEIYHPDYNKLQDAIREVHELALRINCTERGSLELEQIENLIDGLGNLVTGDRTFLRYDMVTMISAQALSRKERALFLFNDLLIITSVKRRNSTVKKPILYSPNTIASSLEANKYKLLMKIPLKHLHIVKVKDENLRKMMKEMEYLSEDVNALSQMIDLAMTLHYPHSQIEKNIRDMLSALKKQLNERHISESQLSHLELAINTRSSVENISIMFPKPEKKTSWGETFLEAKTRLNVSGDRRLNPEFLTSVPIRKTRAGLQFTCAAASCNQQEMWVCNSDGYVGQVCILSLNPEPAVTSCNGVCNARILCVTSVPVSKYIEKCQETSDTWSNTTSSNVIRKIYADNEVNEIIPIENLEREISDIHLDSSSSEEDEENESTDDQKDLENAIPETVDSTMWLGTEDGIVHIYNCADNLRIKRNRMKIQHNYAVYSILYAEKSVYVSLANGDVAVYNWSSNSGWNTTDPTMISVGCVTMPVSRMLLVCGKLWCICHNIIKILNIHTLRVDNSFSIIGENNRAIISVTVCGLSVYVSLQNSAVLRLVHGYTHEILSEINIAPAVTKMLSGTDDIIRQHKAACLRVTSLLACKELLWIGTSAGVILTMPMPCVIQSTTKISSIPHPTGLSLGHTGHVRFLTAVRCQYKVKCESIRRSSKTSEKKPVPNLNKMLIISGGDGYEDFRSSSVSEIAGREDSTNHLLIWKS